MQILASTRPREDVADSDLLRLEEAARYALLQRLTPAIRHHMLGDFQPIGMLAAMMERRLQAPSPDLVAIRDNCASLGNLSRSAASSCMDLLTWVVPRRGATVTVDTGVKECVSLLSTELRFKGILIVNEVVGISREVSCAGLRSVLSAALIVLGDLAQKPSRLLVSAQALPSAMQISLELSPLEDVAANASLAEYRLLGWHDVEILASTESVRLTHTPNGATLVFAFAGTSA